MLPVEYALAEFDAQVASWVAVPWVTPRKKFELSITVLVWRNTDYPTRHKIRRALKRYFRKAQLLKIAHETQNFALDETPETKLRVGVGNYKGDE